MKRTTAVPQDANRRLLGVQRVSHNPIRAAEAFHAVHDPIIADDGAPTAGLRLGDRRAACCRRCSCPSPPERVSPPKRKNGPSYADPRFCRWGTSVGGKVISRDDDQIMIF